MKTASDAKSPIYGYEPTDFDNTNIAAILKVTRTETMPLRRGGSQTIGQYIDDMISYGSIAKLELDLEPKM